MNWYWIVLLAVTGLVGLVVLVGALSPRAHQVACRVHLTQSPPAVFAAITDLAGLSSWRPGLSRVEPLPDQQGRRCYREHTSFGPMDLRVEELVPDRRYVTRIVTPKSPFGGTWTWRLEPRGGGTDVTVTENGEVHNLVFRALARFVFGHTATLRSVLKALGENFGELVEIAPGSPDPAPPAAP